MKRFATICSLFFSIHVMGQITQDIRNLLNKKSFLPFKTYVENPPKSNVTIHCETLREVVPGFQEAVISMQETIPYKEGEGNILNYTINLLATDQTIFYYRISQVKNKKIGTDKWEPYDIVLDTFKNSALYKNFELSFLNTYKARLNEEDLFETEIVYGTGCGLVGTPPHFQEMLTFLLRTNDIKTIHEWLQSANTEKQLYAVQAFKTLTSEGYELTPDEINLIKIISQKKGTASVCGGCMYSSDSIKKIIAGIDANQIYFSSLPSKKPLTNKKSGYSILLLAAILLFSAFAVFKLVKERKRDF